MFCSNCGKEIEVDTKFCKYCGSPVSPPQYVSYEPKKREWLATLLFSFFLGGLGIDRFYLGYTGLGLLKLFTLGGCGIWSLIDFILIAFNKLKDANGNYPVGRGGKEWVAYLLIGLMLAGIFFWFLSLLFSIFTAQDFYSI